MFASMKTLKIAIIIIIASIPKVAIQTFSQGILIWATKILPALLPFFILTKLLSYTTFISTIGKFLSPITKKLYGVGGVSGYIYLMSILSGYPIGAKIIADLYQKKQINENEAKKMIIFCTTSGPIFVIGTVGTLMFKNIPF